MLRLLFSPILIAWWVLFWPFRALRRARAAPTKGLVELTLKGNIIDGPPRPTPWGFLVRRRRQPPSSVASVRRLVDELLADRRPAGVLVRLERLTAGFATAASLRAELARLRAAGRRTVAFLPEGAGNLELHVATACETLVAPPVVDIAPVGVRVSGLFAREALDRAGVDIEVLARKEFKSAGDRLSRSSRSEPDRIQTEALVAALDGALLAALAEGRKLELGDARIARDLGPTRAKVAVERRLLDHAAHDEDVPALIGEPRLVAAGNYLRARRHAPFPLRRRRPLIGVVQIHGTIADEVPLAAGFGRMAVSAQVLADLRAATVDRRIAGVVLDIDSPGGSVVASDAIWSAVRRLAKEKPVVARMGSIAASGGYYVAMAARSVVAHPLTITGSIGVVSLRPIFARLAARLGLSRDAVHLGRFADLDAFLRAPTDEERALLEREMDGHYRDFVELVAGGRRRSVEEIEPLCRGRVWMGEEAQRLGLVDRLGGFEDAVELVRAECPGVEREPVVVVGNAPAHRPPPPAGQARLLEVAGSRWPALAPLLAMLEDRVRIAALATDLPEP